MKNNIVRTLMGCLLAITMGATLARAQTVTATVTGIVSDPSGAVVAGAKVTAHNVDTNVDSSATSDAAGLYRIEYLPIGRYQLTVVAKGFDKQTLAAFPLEALQTAAVNLKLTVGSEATTVTVSEASTVLNNENATLSATLSANTIHNFPLNGQDFSALTLYVPGSVSTVGTSGTTNIERSTYYTDSVNLNGNRAQANNYTLDGIDINESFNNVISYSPAPESLGELKVVTANSPADYGNVNGGGVVAILKSGTNEFHGSAYGYTQDYRFNANSWLNNHVNPIIPTNPFSQSQFGGTLGGPILRNKLFFFVDYLGSRYHTGGIGHANVLTQAMRTGDFSRCSLRSPMQLYDSQNGFAPFTGDKGIPINNPVAKYLFAQSGVLSITECNADRRYHPGQLPGSAAHLQGEQSGRHQDRVSIRRRRTRLPASSRCPRLMTDRRQ